MSEIPIQTPQRGLHEADEEQYFDSDSNASVEPTADLTEPASEVDLDSDPFADDLNKELAAAAPKRWANRATVVIGALVLIVGGFLGGALVEKDYGKSAPTSAAARGFPAGLGGAAGRGGFGGTGLGGTGFGGAGAGNGVGTGPGSAGTGGATAGAATSGTIKLVDGTTVYVQLPNGDILTVKTNGSTKVSIAKSGKLSSLKTGEKVTISGPADSTGTVTASTVTATP